MTDLIRTVRYLTQQEKIRSRALYEEMFWEDEAAFVDAYYKYKGAFNRVLVLEEQGELLSMLHLNPYRERWWRAAILWRWPPGLLTATRAVCAGSWKRPWKIYMGRGSPLPF